MAATKAADRRAINAKSRWHIWRTVGSFAEAVYVLHYADPPQGPDTNWENDVPKKIRDLAIWWGYTSGPHLPAPAPLPARARVSRVHGHGARAGMQDRTPAASAHPLARRPVQAHIGAVSAFIPPSEPVEQTLPPSGDGWIHEVKFDGFRLQLHKVGADVAIWSKKGSVFTSRFRDLAKAMAALPCKTCIIDAEGCALDTEGHPDFRALVGGQKHTRVAWCFDLLEIDGKDLRHIPLITRRVRLAALLKKAADPVLRLSETFADPLKLLAKLDELKLEGIVSKKSGQPYVSGKNRGWIKVKCHAWREANRNRGELLGKVRTRR